MGKPRKPKKRRRKPKLMREIEREVKQRKRRRKKEFEAFYTPKDLSSAQKNIKSGGGTRAYSISTYIVRILHRYCQNGTPPPRMFVDKIRNYQKARDIKVNTYKDGEYIFNLVFPRPVKQLKGQKPLEYFFNNDKESHVNRNKERPYAWKPAIIATITHTNRPYVSPTMRADLLKLGKEVSTIWYEYGIGRKFIRPYDYTLKLESRTMDHGTMESFLGVDEVENSVTCKKARKRDFSMPNYNRTLVQLLFVLANYYTEIQSGFGEYAIQCKLLADLLPEVTVESAKDFFNRAWSAIACYFNDRLRPIYKESSVLSRPWPESALDAFPADFLSLPN